MKFSLIPLVFLLAVTPFFGCGHSAATDASPVEDAPPSPTPFPSHTPTPSPLQPSPTPLDDGEIPPTGGNPGGAPPNSGTGASDPTAVNGGWDFGGMIGGSYTTANSLAQAVLVPFVNFATNAPTCLTGYTKFQVHGSSDSGIVVDNNLFACIRPHVFGIKPDFFYGGMYANGGDAAGNTIHYMNPVTGAMTCPGGYTAVHVAGQAPTSYAKGDRNAYYCAKVPAADETTPAAYYAGAFGKGDRNGTMVFYTNQLVNNANLCPSGFMSQVFAKAPNEDYDAEICYKLGNPPP